MIDERNLRYCISCCEISDDKWKRQGIIGGNFGSFSCCMSYDKNIPTHSGNDKLPVVTTKDAVQRDVKCVKCRCFAKSIGRAVISRLQVLDVLGPSRGVLVVEKWCMKLHGERAMWRRSFSSSCSSLLRVTRMAHFCSFHCTKPWLPQRGKRRWTA